jgi:hypothetical protein
MYIDYMAKARNGKVPAAMDLKATGFVDRYSIVTIFLNFA